MKWCEFLFNQIYWVMFSIWLPFKLRLFINFDWVGSWDATYNLFSIEQNSNWKNLQWNNRSEVLSTYLSLSLSHTHTHTHTTTHTHTRTHTHTHTHTHAHTHFLLFLCNRTPTFHRWSFEARSERLKFERRSFASQLHSYQPI